MSQLTIRDFDPELERHLRSIAAKEGISLNQAAIRLLRRGAGLKDPPHGDTAPVGGGTPPFEGTAPVGGGTPGGRGGCVGESLDRLAGTWSEDESREFLAAVEACEMIDESLWR